MTDLTFWPIEQTAKDMIAELSERDVSAQWRAGLDLKTEAATLKKWHGEKG